MSRSSWIRVGLVVLIFLVAILASGCAPPQVALGEYYRGTWLFDEHEVSHHKSFQGVWGGFEGGFFLASGSVEGSFGTELMIEFVWERQPGERFVTTLPISKFTFLTDETKATPTVEFRFNQDWNDCGSVGFIERWYGSRREVEEGNPNYYLMSTGTSMSNFHGLNTVIVRISSATLEKEIYLPK